MSSNNYRGPRDRNRDKTSLTAIGEMADELGYVTREEVLALFNSLEESVTSVNGQQGDVTLKLFSGDYKDLTNKPTLFSGKYSDLSGVPTIPAAQIQSDWNQTDSSKLDFIKNKPTLFKASDQAVQKVRYFKVSTNASGVWTVDLTGAGFTKVLDVQVQPLNASALISGLRMASLDDFSETATRLTGTAGAISLLGAISLSSGTVVRVRVEGT